MLELNADEVLLDADTLVSTCMLVLDDAGILTHEVVDSNDARLNEAFHATFNRYKSSRFGTEEAQNLVLA